jgi:glycosyltransferase involved in cell wall biosynthesis
VKLSDITLVLATRDEARNIGAFLDSIPRELSLVVVDASRDETPELIERLRPERTLVLREPGNVTEARQRGFEVARSDWLLFSDADVVFAPDYFERLAALDEPAVYYGPKLSRDRFRAYYRRFAWGQALCQAVRHSRCLRLQSAGSEAGAPDRGWIRSAPELQRGLRAGLAYSARGFREPVIVPTSSSTRPIIAASSADVCVRPGIRSCVVCYSTAA